MRQHAQLAAVIDQHGQINFNLRSFHSLSPFCHPQSGVPCDSRMRPSHAIISQILMAFFRKTLAFNTQVYGSKITKCSLFLPLFLGKIQKYLKICAFLLILSVLKPRKGRIMKALSVAFFTLILSTSFAVADGCGSHGKDTAMQCEVGQVWDNTLSACVNTSA